MFFHPQILSVRRTPYIDKFLPIFSELIFLYLSLVTMTVLSLYWVKDKTNIIVLCPYHSNGPTFSGWELMESSVISFISRHGEAGKEGRSLSSSYWSNCKVCKRDLMSFSRLEPLMLVLECNKVCFTIWISSTSCIRPISFEHGKTGFIC